MDDENIAQLVMTVVQLVIMLKTTELYTLKREFYRLCFISQKNYHLKRQL